MLPSMPVRVVLGGVAAVLSVLIFHQGMIALLHGLALPALPVGAPYSMAPVPPYGVPRVVDLCFWGGLYGLVFGALQPVVSRPYWVAGLWLGLVAVLVGFFVVPVIKGLPVGGGSLLDWVRSVLINGAWGIGVGLILGLMTRRPAAALA